MSERSVVKDSWPKDIDVGGDMFTHVSLRFFLPPTVLGPALRRPDYKFPQFFLCVC